MHYLRFGWLVGCFGLNGPFRQYFSLYRAVSQREGERGEKVFQSISGRLPKRGRKRRERIDESKNVQTTHGVVGWCDGAG